FAQPSGQSRDLVGGRVEATDGTVVGVSYRDRTIGQTAHTQRMLEAGLGGRAVTETEVEEADADECRDLSGDRVEASDRRGLGVGHEHPAIGGEIEAGGLG